MTIGMVEITEETDREKFKSCGKQKACRFFGMHGYIEFSRSGQSGL